MTINQAIKKLEEVPKKDRNQQLYAFNYDTGNNYPTLDISPYDDEQPAGKNNPLAIDFTTEQNNITNEAGINK